MYYFSRIILSLLLFFTSSTHTMEHNQKDRVGRLDLPKHPTHKSNSLSPSPRQTGSLSPLRDTRDRGSAPRKRLFKTFSQTKVSSPKTSPRTERPELIEAVRRYDIKAIINCISDPNQNLNQQDEWKNTALHHLIIAPNLTILEKIDIANHLLSDPRLNSSIKNDEKKTAHLLISASDNHYNDYKDLRTSLFARITLDEIVEKEAHVLFMSCDTTDNALNQTVQDIKHQIRTIEHAQEENESLPEAALLPNYATDDFIKKMIASHVQYLQLNKRSLHAPDGPLASFKKEVDSDFNINIVLIESLLTHITFKNQSKPLSEWIINKDFLENTAFFQKSCNTNPHLKLDNLTNLTLMQLSHIIEGSAYFYEKKIDTHSITYNLQKIDPDLKEIQPPLIVLKGETTELLSFNDMLKR